MRRLRLAALVVAWPRRRGGICEIGGAAARPPGGCCRANRGCGARRHCRDRRDPARRSRESRHAGLGALRPANQGCWRPTRLSSRNSALLILGAVVTRLRLAGKQGPIVKRVDIDDAQDLIATHQDHSNVDATPTTDDLLRRFQAKCIELKLLSIGGRQDHLGSRVGERTGIVLPAERALAGAQYLVARQLIADQLDADSPAMALASIDHFALRHRHERARSNTI